MDSMHTTPTPTTPSLLAGQGAWSSPIAAQMLGCGMGLHGRPPRGHILSLPTELLATIFELANEENPFLLANGEFQVI